MTMKLGELLVKAGLVTLDELDEGLNNQVIFGGRLGSNLIEMGYLDEQELASILSKRYSVSFVAGENLMDIPKDVLNLLPLKLIQKYKVLPLKLDKKRLTLAMLDPMNLQGIDEISFATGYVIEPVICPEYRLALALEKHFKIAKEKRYSTMTGKIRTRPTQKPAEFAIPEKPDPIAHPEASAYSKMEEVIELPLLGDISIEDIDDYLMETVPTDIRSLFSARGRQQLLPSSDEPVERDNVEVLSKLLSNPQNRDDIADAINKYTANYFDRSAFFLIKDNIAGGWKAQAKGEDVKGFSYLSIPLDAPSILKVVNDGKSLFLGQISETPSNSIILKGVKAENPPCSLLIPLLMMDRVVAVFYVDGSKENLAVHLNEFKRIIVKAIMAFEILILKNKILSL